MTTDKSLIVELLVEELPPKALKKLGESFANLIFDGLKSRNLIGSDEKFTAYSSPRRLAVHVSNVLATAPDHEIKEKLMPVSVALDADGKPTDALRKRLAKVGRAALADMWPNAVDGSDKLYVASDGKADTVFLRSLANGSSLQVGLQSTLKDTLEKLPIPKVMTYQLADGWSDVNFVRPAHGLLALHGSEVVSVSVLGLDAGRETQGHRFEAKAPTIAISSADSYESQLETEGAVVASLAKRREQIAAQLAAVAAKEKLSPIVDEALLDEVTALVERPNVLAGTFEKEFLQVPQECLILTMKANQKYFPLLDGAGKLSNKFLIVSNIHPADSSFIVSGNERVIRARLADAKFFFDQDRKKTLASRLAGLDKVVYHNKLGSQGERTLRVRAIAKAIADQVSDDALRAKVTEQADQAAMLAKADLTTDMVGEFPELQGIMGRYYAQAEGIGDDIAFAIEDHYKPRFAGDELPRNQIGVCVALADKLETLVGIFGIGQIPTGDKDPFALRRHALGVIRILIEKRLALDLNQLISMTWDKFPIGSLSQSQAEVEKFVLERIGGYLRELTYTANEVDAVLSVRPERIFHIPKLLAAVRAFAALPEAESLAAANKRVGNILKKSEAKINGEVNPALLQEHAEKLLHQALLEIAPKANYAYTGQNYTALLQMLAPLKLPIDAFFDNVMVNVEDPALRNNRLALLLQLQQTMNRVADLSKLAT